MPGSGTWVPLVLLLVRPPELELDDELELEDELDELDDEDELLDMFQPEVEPVQPEVEPWLPARAGAEMARLPSAATTMAVLRSIGGPLLVEMVTATRRKGRAIARIADDTLVNADSKKARL